MIRISRKQSVLLIALLINVALMAACGSNSRNNSDSTKTQGYIRFSLEWPTTHAGQQAPGNKSISFAPSGDVCQDYLVQNITVGVYTTSNALVTNLTFSCSAHTGFVPVSPGSYNIMVDGISSIGSDDWRGQKTSITVTTAATTDAGGVTMNYIGTDNIPPTVSSITPTNNATGVPINSSVNVIFNEDIAAWSLDISSFVLTRGTVTTLGNVTYASASKIATFLPTTNLSERSVYTATTTTYVRDLAMNNLVSPYTWTFTTAATPSPGYWDTWMIWDTDLWN